MIVLRLQARSQTVSRISTFAILLAACVLPAFAQIDTLRAARDSALVIRPGAIQSLSDTAPEPTGSYRYEQKKSPWLAVGLSAIAPGAGQIYIGNYWKPPLIWAVGGYWIYEWVKLNGKYQDYSDLYTESFVTAPPSGNALYRKNRDFYRDERDKFAWFLGALYFVNLVDAYVGAHLYEFDVSPDLGADGRAVPRVMATIRLRF